MLLTSIRSIKLGISGVQGYGNGIIATIGMI